VSEVEPGLPRSGIQGPAGALLARNTLLNLIGQALPLALAILTIPYVVRGLGAERFGILAVATAVLGYFGMFDLGLGRATTRFVADALGRGEERRVRRIIATATAVQGGMGLVAALLIHQLASWLAVRMVGAGAPGLVAEAAQAFAALSLAIPLILVTSSLRGALEAAQRFDLVNAVNIPATGASLLIPAAAVALGLPLPALILLLVGAKGVALGVFGALCLRVFPRMDGSVRPDARVLRELLGFGGWITVSNVLLPVMAYLERFLIPYRLGVSALTFYAVPFEILMRLSFIPASFASTLFPAFSYRHAHERGVSAGLVLRPVKYVLLAMTPIATFLLIFAPEILGVWIGPEMATRGAPVLRLLSLAFLLNAVAYIPFAALQGMGRPDLKAKLDLAETPLIVVLLWTLLPVWGIAGAAVAKLVVALADGAALFWLAFSVGGWSARGHGLRRGAAASAVYMGGAAAGVAAAGSTAWGLAVYGLATAAYVGALWTAAFDGRDREVLRGVLRRSRAPARGGAPGEPPGPELETPVGFAAEFLGPDVPAGELR
jgi:O-antigen/teichoic acid export membrane protein